MYTPYYREMLDETVRRERRAFESHYASERAAPARPDAVPAGKSDSTGKAPSKK